jgi:hypothetical protein
MPFALVGPSQLFQIDVRDGLRQGKDGVLHVVVRPEVTALFAKQGNENEATPGTAGKPTQRIGDINNR